jgi:hypothetical protein
MSHVNNNNVFRMFEGGLRFNSRRISVPPVSRREACRKVKLQWMVDGGSEATTLAISQQATIRLSRRSTLAAEEDTM